ncbi:MAG: hypothetical protein Q7R60_01045 [bacterium]|nr:hypothetical protein [bacterium]
MQQSIKKSDKNSPSISMLKASPTVDKPSVISQSISNIRGVERSNEIAHLLTRLGSIETTVHGVRDLICFYVDLTHELPDESKTIRIDAQALRGTMTRLYAELEDAIESLATVQAMASLLDDKSVF